MPGLCGFIVRGQDRPQERLQTLLEDLRHHPDHSALPAFSDNKVTAGLVLRKAGQGGAHWEGPTGIQVWIDGEAFDETGLMPGAELAAQLATGTPRPLNGTFAAVIYDPQAEQIRFITDPYGLKYLYVRTTDFPAWSGDQRSFLKMQGPPPVFNAACLREFLEHGHPLGKTTWFNGIELLEPGLLLTHDLKSRKWSRQRYFKLEDQQPGSPIPSWNETVEQLGGLFRKAVSRRCSHGLRSGLTLSGGLDSRAILAALPKSISPVETVTFGKPGCTDEILAKAASAVRDTPHTFVPLGEEGWLEARKTGVELTDGVFNILHLHGLESLPIIEDRMDFCLNGFLGDGILGGRWTAFPDQSAVSNFAARYLNRGRRFVLQSLHYGGTDLIYRLPFMDFTLLQFSLSLPRAWLKNSRVYRAMLLREFPEYFQTIPWEKTGLPVSSAAWREKLAVKMRGLRRRLGIGADGYADYPGWLRRGSAAEFLRSHLEPSDARIHRFFPAGKIAARLRDHSRGKDESEKLGRYLTAEIWLRFLAANNIT